MPLIEVVPGPKTSRATLLRAVEFARRLGKTPIVVKDGNGFLVNRVLMSYLNEALLLLEEGMPFPEIDRAVVGWGMPMGPYELLDEIGIKVSMKVSHVLSSSYPDRTEPGRLHNVIAGSDRLVGKSSGEGFYLYAKGKRKTPNPLVASILVANGVKPAAKADIQAAMERCAMRLVNEAALCMQDGLVERPDQLDLAMILGTGFPPFRGGLLAWADSEGLAKFAKRLSLLEEKYGKRFKPALNLTTENGGRGRFYV
jgi:3-hydroxyacyl-CoA dehydrogenase/enoyl-CoA hydratase/3-hydroxybutyryl-CoA epimerase